MPSSRSESAGVRRARKVLPVPRELRDLISLSREVGDDPDGVQGGGGNTSVKTGDGLRMYVKASGVALGEVDENRGWAELDLPAARAILDEPRLADLPAAERERRVLALLEAAVVRPAGARPSVESSLHAFLGRVVIHTHPVGMNAALSSRGSSRVVRDLLEGIRAPVLCLPYVDPGFVLATRVRKELEVFRSRTGSLPDVLALENHGVFVSASTVEDCVRLARRVAARGRRWIGRRRVNPKRFAWVERPGDGRERPPLGAEVRGALLRGGAHPAVVRRDETEPARELVRRPTLLKSAGRGAFTPDQIVYCRTYPLVLPAPPGRARGERWTKAVRDYRARRGMDPRVVLVPGDGVYYAAPHLRQLRVVGETYRGAIVTLMNAHRAGGPRFLRRAQARFIEDWEVERFRARQAEGAARRLEGRVAVVTGGGSGLGKGIAGDLAKRGATVFALDVDEDALESSAEEHGRDRFLPVRCDVTDEESVTAAFRAVVRSAGGVDYLVNAAGIAPSAPLVDFPLAAWRRTLDINLTGYFLCAREAARWLLRQGAGGAIVNLTSKSGLEASKENSAYNATKAGEIHLMRGWAMELGSAGIRVNCVAPGNVFKGSRIWNPDYILACARKKGIRPEQVIPYYTSMSALGREIEPDDVAAGVAFLLSEEARQVTGQVLVVDGGQVMVR